MSSLEWMQPHRNVRRKWIGALKYTCLHNGNRHIAAGWLSLILIYNWRSLQETTEKNDKENLSRSSNLLFSMAFMNSGWACFLESKEETLHGIAVKRNWASVFWNSKPSPSGPLSVRFKLSSIGYWSWLRITQPWFILNLTSSTAWFLTNKMSIIASKLKIRLSAMPVCRQRVA